MNSVETFPFQIFPISRAKVVVNKGLVYDMSLPSQSIYVTKATKNAWKEKGDEIDVSSTNKFIHVKVNTTKPSTGDCEKGELLDATIPVDETDKSGSAANSDNTGTVIYILLGELSFPGDFIKVEQKIMSDIWLSLRKDCEEGSSDEPLSSSDSSGEEESDSNSDDSSTDSGEEEPSIGSDEEISSSGDGSTETTSDSNDTGASDGGSNDTGASDGGSTDTGTGSGDGDSSAAI